MFAPSKYLYWLWYFVGPYTSRSFDEPRSNETGSFLVFMANTSADFEEARRQAMISTPFSSKPKETTVGSRTNMEIIGIVLAKLEAAVLISGVVGSVHAIIPMMKRYS